MKWINYFTIMGTGFLIRTFLAEISVGKYKDATVSVVLIILGVVGSVILTKHSEIKE